ncbi:MAG: membrane protein insertion efficiency factor YidD [candidate division WOR-3 bacterium]
MLADLLKFFIRGYQFTLGTVLPNSCRFQPSCSHYAFEAISRYGAGKGMVLALKRVLRCHPFSSGGYDPVPDSICRGVGNNQKERI